METVSDEVEFVSFIDKPGLNVIDVYQTWCGPCKSIQGMRHTQCDSSKIGPKTSSNQNSILKKGTCRTFLFQTENLFFNIDFMGRKLQKSRFVFIGNF